MSENFKILNIKQIAWSNHAVHLFIVYCQHFGNIVIFFNAATSRFLNFSPQREILCTKYKQIDGKNYFAHMHFSTKADSNRERNVQSRSPQLGMIAMRHSTYSQSGVKANGKNCESSSKADGMVREMLSTLELSSA